jgi:hypothetical protein
MPIVNIQGVGLVNFPDEMSREQINSAIEKEILPKFPEVQAQVPRGFVGGAKDIGASFVSGVGNLMQLPGQISELVGFTRTGDLPEQQKTGLQALGADIQKFGEEAKSPTLVAKEQLRAREIDKAEGFFQEAGAALRTTVTDPALLTSFFAEQIPNLVGTYGFGALGKGGAKLLMKEATEQAMAKVGVGSAVAGGAVMQGTDVGYDTYQTIYKQLREQGVPDEEAQGIALSKGRVAAIEAAGLSLASARLPGGTAIERALVGKGMPGTAGFLKSTLGEAASEALEEGGGAFAKQVGIQEVFPETDLLKGVGAATALGGLGGVLLGAPAGVVNALRARQETPPPLVPSAEPPAPTGVIPPEPPPQLPLETFPPEQPTAVTQAPPAQVTPPTFAEPAEDPFKNYFTGMPKGSEILFQNRDRSTPASIAQMQGIASAPDYKRVSYSRDFGNGAPVVISDIDIESSLAKYPDSPIGVTGAKDFAVLPNGQSVPMMYAVVENGVLLTSNNADGSKRALYEDTDKPGLRAIAGNGRIAGITKAYTTPENSEAAEKYKSDLIADAKNLGIDPEVVNKMTAPVLVRVMPKSYLTPDIADLSNRPTVARLSPVETAKNDIRRFDLGGLEFNEDGTPSGKTLMQFINAMPVEERTELTDKSGRPTAQAIDRLANAIFQKAYGSDSLIDLYAQAADPEAKTILNALARVAPKMAQLEGAGEYDVRNALIQAAELAVNARRAGTKLADAAKQISMDVDPNSALVLNMFANNIRSGKRIGERLNALADEALAQVQAGGTDMFGAVPKKPLSEVFKALETPPEEPGLFAEPAPKTKAPIETKPESEPIDFDIDKSKEQIAKEIDGLTIPELGQWAIDNANNSAARAVATKVKKVLDGLAAKNMFPKKVNVRNGDKRFKTRISTASGPQLVDSGVRGETNTTYGSLGTTFKLEFNGVQSNGDADKFTAGYVTILHELLHVATNGELRILQTTSQIYKDLEKIRIKVRRQVNLDIAAGKKSPILSRIARGANTIKNPRELVAWGLTDTDFQLYLSKIKVGKQKTLFNELVDVFRRLLGINEEYETALEAVIRATDQILEKPISEIAAEIGKTGVRFESEKAFTRQFKTDDGYTFYQLPDGKVVDNLDPNIVDMSWDNVKDFKKSVGKDVAEEGIDLGKLPPGRSRELAVAAKQLQQGNITREQFEEMVNKYAPIAPVPAPRQPASTEAMRNALATNQKDKLNPDIADGTPVGLRMDINALRKGASVVSIHQGSNTSKVGQVIGYGSVAAATDVKFSNRNQQALLKVATGEGKLPAQTMEGKYKNISPEEAYKRINELLNDPEWIQVGVDPTRHGYFYDRANAMPVKSADELIQVGNFVLAKNAQYDSKENYLYEQVPTGRQIDTPAFKRWFGDSKVVDENSKPLVMYHGTAEELFNIFNKEKIRADDYDTPFNGFWFSSDKFTSPAMRNAKNTIPVFLSIKNPAPSDVWKQVSKQVYKESDLNQESALRKGARSVGDEIRYRLQDMGYDGIQYSGKPNINKEEFKKTGQVSFKDFSGKSYTLVKNDEDGGVDLYDGKVTGKPNLEKDEYITGYLDLDNFLETGSEQVWVAFEPNQIKSATGNKGTFSPEREEIDEEFTAPVAIAKAKELLQKRKPIPMGAFADVDPKLVQLAQPVFYPQQKTIIDRIEGLRDNFWKKTAQGIADQFRAIKDYTEEGYMQARLSKTVDGALEGLTFFGQVFDDNGALNIKQGTKGLMDIMKPIGKEVDRYQMWVALNRESQLPMEKRTKMPNMGELIKRRNEFAAGTIDGKPRLEIYEKVRSDMNVLNKSVLKVALDKGLIDSSRQKIDELNTRDFLTTKDKEILTRPYREEIERIENKKAMNVTEEDKDILKDYRALVRDINSLNNMTPDLRQELVDYYTNNPGAYERFSADINYIPFYRAMEDGDLQGASTASGLTNQQFSKELTGGERPYGDLMENTLRNWSHILSASMKNQASNTTLKAATEFGAAMPNLKIQYEFIDGKVVNRSTGEIIGDGEVKPYMTTADKGTVKIMSEGQPLYYRVLDPMLLDSISSIGYMGPKNKFLDVARDFKNMLQFGVTVSPAFKVRNLFRDSISAIAVTDLKKNPFANVIEGWAASNRNNPAHISALAGGAIFNFGTAYEGDQSKLIKRLLDQGVDANTILDSPEKVKKGLTILWEKYKDWGNKSEAANRMALYNQLKAKGYNHLEASFYARDLLDFSMQGSWPAFRLAAQTIPFLNARVQGLYKLGRDGITPTTRVLYNTITGKDIEANDAQKARAFGYTTLAVAMASMLLYLTFKDDEEFQKREAWDRDNFWWIRLPGMDAAFRVPKPFEIGAFGTMAERVLEQIVDQGAEGKAFGDSMFRMLTDTFAINPIPQMIRPLVDLYANKDAFTGAPIESAGMERLSKQERVTDNTSPIAQALGGLSSIFGEKVSLSPVQVDYAIKAYFGWLGGTATQASVYATVPFRDGAYPDIKLMDKVSQGFIKSLPSDQSRFVTSFYENNKEINQAYADMRHYAELGETDKVQKILEEKGDKIALNKMYDKTAKEMANVRAQIRVITNDKTMDGTTKREMIDRMKQILSALAEQAENARKSLKPN